jgi:hypothetical protein
MVTIDQSGANLAAVRAINVERETPIQFRDSPHAAMAQSEE